MTERITLRTPFADLIHPTVRPKTTYEERGSPDYMYYCKPPEGCGRRFYSMMELTHHRRTCEPPPKAPSGEEHLLYVRAPARCVECDEIYTFPFALVLHYQEVHGLK